MYFLSHIILKIANTIHPIVNTIRACFSVTYLLLFEDVSCFLWIYDWVNNIRTSSTLQSVAVLWARSRLEWFRERSKAQRWHPWSWRAWWRRRRFEVSYWSSDEYRCLWRIQSTKYRVGEWYSSYDMRVSVWPLRIPDTPQREDILRPCVWTRSEQPQPLQRSEADSTRVYP